MLFFTTNFSLTTNDILSANNIFQYLWTSKDTNKCLGLNDKFKMPTGFFPLKPEILSGILIIH